jgi:TatD DNase family protein
LPLAAAPGVLHSFSGDDAFAQRVLELGFYIGITGPVTYPNAHGLRDLVSKLPLERILIETDSPFLPPQAHRGQRNEPAFVSLVAEKIASLLNLTAAQVAERTTENAGRLFHW